MDDKRVMEIWTEVSSKTNGPCIIEFAAAIEAELLKEEPVAWIVENGVGYVYLRKTEPKDGFNVKPLYTHPAAPCAKCEQHDSQREAGQMYYEGLIQKISQRAEAAEVTLDKLGYEAAKELERVCAERDEAEAKCEELSKELYEVKKHSEEYVLAARRELVAAEAKCEQLIYDRANAITDAVRHLQAQLTTARNDALEEAAKVCDERHLAGTAELIRALKEKK